MISIGRSRKTLNDVTFNYAYALYRSSNPARNLRWKRICVRSLLDMSSFVSFISSLPNDRRGDRMRNFLSRLLEQGLERAVL